MQLHRFALAVLIVGLVAPPVLAQGTAQAVAVPAVENAAQLVLRQGTQVRFKTEQALTSKETKEGDRFELTSVEPVYVGSMLVIPAGSRAVGEVTRVVKKGGFGKSGKLDARVLYVLVGDTRIGMTGKANDQGASGTVGTVAAAVFLWPVMPFVTGKSAELPIGTSLTGFVENDIPLAVGAFVAPKPLIVPAPAAVPK